MIISHFTNPSPFKKLLLLLFIVSSLFISCEKSDLTADNFWPQVGDRLDRVEFYWGPPDDRETYYDGDLFYVTYYYYGRGVFIDFYEDRVDLIGNL